jgi:DNA-binding CsgD family transcriptional regulator
MVDATEELLHVIEAAYSCALQPSRLPQFLEQLNNYMGTVGTHLLSASPSGWQVQAVCASAAGARDWYQKKWNIEAPAARDIARLPKGMAFAFREFPEVFKAQLESTGASARDWSSGVGAVVGSDGTSWLMVVALQATGSPTHAKNAKARMQRVLPHLARAFLFVQSAEGSLLSLPAAGNLLRHFPIGCLLTDAAGRCLEPNQAFLEMLPQLAMEVVGGRVRFGDPYLQASWQSALFETSETAVSHTILASAAKSKQWKAHLLPIQCLTGEQETLPRHLILVIFEEQASSQGPSAESYASVGKLTPAELEVMSGLMQGYSAKVIAKARGASVNTVRSQIVAILGKTGHRSQKELIAAFGASSFDASSFNSRS